MHVSPYMDVCTALQNKVHSHMYAHAHFAGLQVRIKRTKCDAVLFGLHVHVGPDALPTVQ
jgi:hypothetical protein